MFGVAPLVRSLSNNKRTSEIFDVNKMMCIKSTENGAHFPPFSHSCHSIHLFLPVPFSETTSAVSHLAPNTQPVQCIARIKERVCHSMFHHRREDCFRAIFRLLPLLLLLLRLFLRSLFAFLFSTFFFIICLFCLLDAKIVFMENLYCLFIKFMT